MCLSEKPTTTPENIRKTRSLNPSPMSPHFMTGNGYHHLVTLNLVFSRQPDWPDWHCKRLATISKLSGKESRIHQNPTHNPNTYSTERAGVRLETALSKYSCFLGPKGSRARREESLCTRETATHTV